MKKETIEKMIKDFEMTDNSDDWNYGIKALVLWEKGDKSRLYVKGVKYDYGYIDLTTGEFQITEYEPQMKKYRMNQVINHIAEMETEEEKAVEVEAEAEQIEESEIMDEGVEEFTVTESEIEKLGDISSFQDFDPENDFPLYVDRHGVENGNRVRLYWGSEYYEELNRLASPASTLEGMNDTNRTCGKDGCNDNNDIPLAKTGIAKRKERAWWQGVALGF